MRELHVVLQTDEATALHYGAIARRLRARGRLIGTSDLWIAASARRHDVPLATANVEAFRRVDGLDVVAYR